MGAQDDSLVDDLKPVYPGSSASDAQQTAAFNDNWGSALDHDVQPDYPPGERAIRQPMSSWLCCWNTFRIMNKNKVSVMMFGALYTSVGVFTGGAMLPALLVGLHNFMASVEDDDELLGKIDELWGPLRPINKKLFPMGVQLFLLQILLYVILFPVGGFYFGAVYLYASFIFCLDPGTNRPRALKELLGNSKDIVTRQSTTRSHVWFVFLQNFIAFSPIGAILYFGFFLTDYFCGLFVVFVTIPFMYISAWYGFHELVLRGDCVVPEAIATEHSTPPPEGDTGSLIPGGSGRTGEGSGFRHR